MQVPPAGPAYAKIGNPNWQCLPAVTWVFPVSSSHVRPTMWSRLAGRPWLPAAGFHDDAEHCEGSALAPTSAVGMGTQATPSLM